MKTRMKLILVAGGVVLPVAGAARPKDKTDERAVKQIIVRVHRSSYSDVYTVADLGVLAGGRPLHDMRVYLLKKGEVNHWFAEIKCNDCQVFPIFDDDVQLSAITQFSEMAVNAGFKSIRPFILETKTGQMREVQSGPSMKFTMDIGKIEHCIRKGE